MADNLENLSDEELIAQYQQKIGKAPAPQDDLDSLSDDELIQLAQQKQTQPQQPARTGQAALEGFGQSVSFGYLPQIQAGIESLLPSPTSEADLKLQQMGIQQEPETYLSRRDENLRRQQQLQQEAPITYGAGQLAGGIAASAPMVGGTAATLGGRALQAAGIGALEGAAYNPGDIEGQYGGLQLQERAKQGVVGAATGSVGQVLGSGVSKVAEKLKELPTTFKNYAELKAFKQSGAMLKDFRKNLGNNKANEIGREMLDKGIVSTGDSFEDIATKASAIKNEAASELSQIYKQSIDSVDLNNPEVIASKIDAAKMAQDLRSEFDKQLKGKPGSKKVLSRLEEELSTLSENGSDLSLDEAVKLKTSFDDLINYNKEIKDDTLLNQQFRQIRRKLNNAIDKRVEVIGKLTGDKELFNKLQSAKKTYGNMSEVSSIAKDRIARENANRLFSLGDRISGVSGAALGGMQSGDIEGAIKGGIAGLLVGKASRMGGNAVSAKAIDSTAKILEKNPVLLGKFAEPLTMAATKSPKAFASTVEKFRRDPEFQTIIEQRKKALLKD